jgi:hypothetical protein
LFFRKEPSTLLEQSSSKERPMHIFLVLALLFIPLTAQALTLDFEDLPEETFVTDQYLSLGVSFEHAIILTAGVNLDDYDYPPHSGSNVLSDSGGPVMMTFSTPMAYFSLHTTYGLPLTISILGTDGGLLEEFSSAFSSNGLVSGDPGSQPNELIAYTRESGIGAVVIAGASSGGSFVLDDLSITSLPEAPPWLFLASALLSLICLPHLLRARYKVVRRYEDISRKGGSSS